MSDDDKNTDQNQDPKKIPQPGDANYDVLKEKKVIEQRDRLLSRNAGLENAAKEKEGELTGLKTELQAFKDAKKKVEDEKLSEIEKLTKKIEQLTTDFSGYKAEAEKEKGKTRRENFELRTQEDVRKILDTHEVIANPYELDGVYQRALKKVTPEMEGEERAEVMVSIVGQFVEAGGGKKKTGADKASTGPKAKVPSKENLDRVARMREILKTLNVRKTNPNVCSEEQAGKLMEELNKLEAEV